jgi:RNA polymerase sigma-70 factor (sigma-E family)
VAQQEIEAFVLARGDALHRSAYWLTRDHGLAEDLLQTALAKAWGAWSRIEGDPEPYVRRVMVTTYTTWWRRRWNGEHPTAELPVRPSPDRTDDVAVGVDLASALSHLPRRQRAVIVLRYLEDLTEAQTADLMGTTVGTVKSQTAKALAALRIDPSVSDEADPPRPTQGRPAPAHPRSTA